MTDEVDFKDFTKKRPEIRLGLNGRTLVARPRLGIVTAQKVMGIRSKLADAANATDEEKIGSFREMFAHLLHSQSAPVFDELLMDEDEPVDLDQVMDMMNHIMERQGLRPTQPSTQSSDSSPVEPSGTTSTDGVSDAT